MNVALFRVVRLVIRTDSDPARQALFQSMLQGHPLARLVSAVHERIAGSRASALLVSGYGAAAFVLMSPRLRRGARVLAFAGHANARRQVGLVATWIGDAECDRIQRGPSALLRPSSLAAVMRAAAGGRLFQVLRIVRRVDAKFGFLVSCRVAGAIGWYARSRMILTEHRPGAVLVSSDAQPEEVAFVAAARRLAIPQVFASHAYPTPLSPPLDFSLSILEGEAEVDARRHVGAIKGQVVLAGIPGASAPMDASRLSRPTPVIGIFAPKAVSWPVFQALVSECLERADARRVVIRWHPSMLDQPHLDQLAVAGTRVVTSPREASLEEVTRECDWVIADENSHVHLPVLKLGIPTLAFRLGVYPESRSDQYGLIANRIVYPRLQSLAEVEPASVAAFFADCWATRFARYDAAYLRPADAVGSEVRQAVQQLLDTRLSMAPIR